MGVLGERKNPYIINIESDENEIITAPVDEPAEPADIQSSPKKSRKYRPRYWYLDSPKGPSKSKHGVRHMRRIDHLNQLLATTEEMDCEEPELLHIVEPSSSRFSDLFLEQEKMQIWNDFISQTEEQQELFLSGMNVDLEEDISGEVLEKWEKLDLGDKREAHPAFSSEECFKRIDTGLKSVLKKRHFPMGYLMHLEQEIVSFFKGWPSSVLLHQLPNSYDRLLVHALCQYFNLSVKSFNDDHGVRQTEVENKYASFTPPTLTLTEYLLMRH